MLAGKRTLLSQDNLVITGSLFGFTPSYCLTTVAPNIFELSGAVVSAAFQAPPSPIVPTTTNLGRLFNSVDPSTLAVTRSHRSTRCRSSPSTRSTRRPSR